MSNRKGKFFDKQHRVTRIPMPKLSRDELNVLAMAEKIRIELGLEAEEKFWNIIQERGQSETNIDRLRAALDAKNNKEGGAAGEVGK